MIQVGWLEFGIRFGIKLWSNVTALELETKRSVPVLDLEVLRNFFQGSALIVLALFGVAALFYFISLFRLPISLPRFSLLRFSMPKKKLIPALVVETQDDSVLNEKTEVLIRETPDSKVPDPTSPARPALLQATPLAPEVSVVPPASETDELLAEQTLVLSSPAEEAAPPPAPDEDSSEFGDDKTEILEVKTKPAEAEKASPPLSNQELPSPKSSAQNAPQMPSKSDAIFKIDEEIDEALQRDFDSTEEIPIFDPAKMDEALESAVNEAKERGTE